MDLLQEFFLSLGLLSLIALFGAFLSARWRQPTVVGLLLVGALAGPHALGLIRDSEVVRLLGEFGAALLLFSIGVEFSLSKILGSGLRAAVLASAILACLFFVGYECAIVLGMDYLSALAVGACLSFSSTAIFIRLLSAQGLLQESCVPLLVSVLVMEDIVAVGAMAFFTAIPLESAQAGGRGAAPDATAILMSLLFSLVLLGVAYLFMRAILKRLRTHFLAIKSEENLVLMALGLCVLLSMLASAIGLSPSIGAFLAGSMLGSLSIKDEAERVIHPFLLAFSSFFFISVGLSISLPALLQFWPAILLFSAAFILCAFLWVTLLTYLSGLGLEQALIAGASMAALGEFSLLLAEAANPVVPNLDMVSVMSMVVLVSAIASSLLLSARQPLAAALRSRLPADLRAKLKSLRAYFASVLREFESDGAFLTQARSSYRALRTQLALFAGAGVLLLALRLLLPGFNLVLLGLAIPLSAIILLAALLALAPALLHLAHELRLLAQALRAVFIRTHVHAPDREGRRIARDFQWAVAFGLLVVALPLAVEFGRLPDFFHLLVLLPLAALALVLGDLLSHLLRLFPPRPPGKVK